MSVNLEAQLDMQQQEQNYSSSDTSLDHFIHENGGIYAGKHYIIDLWGASGLDSTSLMRLAFEEGIEACGATLLHMHFHHFTPNGGVSGVAVLAESHISVHTWPEKSFAAFDVFMCGNAQPEKLVAILERHFSPSQVQVKSFKRGVIREEGDG